MNIADSGLSSFLLRFFRSFHRVTCGTGEDAWRALISTSLPPPASDIASQQTLGTLFALTMIKHAHNSRTNAGYVQPTWAF
eukprot:scaffold388360_cov19-Prasinocladus_malaysianus.AAC.1